MQKRAPPLLLNTIRFVTPFHEIDFRLPPGPARYEELFTDVVT